MCFAFKREWILQIKHLGGGETEKLLTEVHSCTDDFHFLILAPVFLATFFLHKPTPQNKNKNPQQQQQKPNPKQSRSIPTL